MHVFDLCNHRFSKCVTCASLMLISSTFPLLGFVKEVDNMSRPMLLVFLLLVLIVTSQFEWRQQLMSDVDTSSKDSHKQEQISKREEIIKEKVIVVFF